MFRADFDRDAGAIEALSRLERQIWDEKRKSASNLEVALKLCLSEEAVKRHLRAIGQKMQDWHRRQRQRDGRL